MVRIIQREEKTNEEFPAVPLKLHSDPENFQKSTLAWVIFESKYQLNTSSDGDRFNIGVGQAMEDTILSFTITKFYMAGH